VLRQLLICGLVAGLAAGLLATGFATLAGEPAVDGAIAYEEAHAGAEPVGHHDAAPVSRDVQRTFGLTAAAVVYGVSLGGLFALAFAVAYGRAGRASPRVTAYWLAAAAFTVVFLVPFAKYPATPPAVGDPDTIGRRTALYVTMILISIVAAIAAARLRPALAARLGGHGGALLALGSYLAIVVAAALALPGIHEVPKDFPAATLWRFREASVGMQAVLWLTIGLVFANAAQRVMTGRPVLPRRNRESRALRA
jgi:hypothetical protein